MSQPPYGPDPGRPQDQPPAFPTYGRPEQPPAPQQPSGWAAPGQPTPPQPPPPAQPQPTPAYQPGPYQPGPPQPNPYQAAPQQGFGQPYPQAYGYGYPAQGASKTNPMAIAAIACGLGGLATMISAPFGVGFGIAALVQLRKRPAETGKGLAITGIVSGGLITLGYGLLFTLIAVFSSGVDDDPYSAPLPGTSTSGTYVDELAVGECYDDGDEDGEVTRRDCARPHDGEVISNVTLPDGPYPGDAEVDRLGKVRCGEEFATYVGKTADKSELDLAWWTPTKRLWERDHDRLVVCSAYGAASGDRLTGSVKGTKR